MIHAFNGFTLLASGGFVAAIIAIRKWGRSL